jgi:hypothetical protein
MDYEFLVDAGFICDVPAATASVIRDMTNGELYTRCYILKDSNLVRLTFSQW